MLHSSSVKRSQSLMSVMLLEKLLGNFIDENKHIKVNWIKNWSLTIIYFLTLFSSDGQISKHLMIFLNAPSPPNPFHGALILLGNMNMITVLLC